MVGIAAVFYTYSQPDTRSAPFLRPIAWSWFAHLAAAREWVEHHKRDYADRPEVRHHLFQADNMNLTRDELEHYLPMLLARHSRERG